MAKPVKAIEPHVVRITTGPHGHRTTLEIDGVPVKGACAFTLASRVDGPTTLTVEYVGIKVEVDALVDETAFDSTYKEARRITLVENE